MSTGFIYRIGIAAPTETIYRALATEESIPARMVDDRCEAGCQRRSGVSADRRTSKEE